jgi:GDPmannose 4,6-dehydratase
MLQQDVPDDFVIATGESRSVREFLNAAAACVDLDWHEFVETDARYYRPTEVPHLEGDSSKARQILGWTPRVDFTEMVKMMVEHDLELARRELTLAEAGYDTPARGLAVR